MGGRIGGVVHASLQHADSGAFDVGGRDVARFQPSDPAALRHLNREGYVVIENMDVAEVERARELLWSFLEATGAGISRTQPDTWIRSRPNPYGIVWHHGVGHSRLAWFIRTRPNLLEMFERVWNTSELISSFEGFSWLPPKEYEHAWQIVDSWFHTDQNGVSRPGRQTVQSFTSLYDQDESTGAFVIAPRSHTQHARVTERVYRARPQTPPDQQFLMLPSNDPILHNASKRRPHLVRVRAGDSVLWDSRAVHCSTPSLHRAAPSATPFASIPLKPASSGPRPARVVVYASLSPRSRADEGVLLARQRALCERRTCTHWPFDMACLDAPRSVGEEPSDPIVHVPSRVKQLVGYTDAQIRRWLVADASIRAQQRSDGRAFNCPPAGDGGAVADAVSLFASPRAVSLSDGEGNGAVGSKCPRRRRRGRRRIV